MHRQWYLRSAGHTDAHYGSLGSEGTVLAVCGRSFRPQPGMFEPGPAVLSPPVDPAQCCPACRNTLTTDTAGHHDEHAHDDADADALRGLVDSL